MNRFWEPHFCCTLSNFVVSVILSALLSMSRNWYSTQDVADLEPIRRHLKGQRIWESQHWFNALFGRKQLILCMTQKLLDKWRKYFQRDKSNDHRWRHALHCLQSNISFHLANRTHAAIFAMEMNRNYPNEMNESDESGYSIDDAKQQLLSECHVHCVMITVLSIATSPCKQFFLSHFAGAK